MRYYLHQATDYARMTIAHCSRMVLFTIPLLLPAYVNADDVEPRLYSNVPTGANFLSVGYSRSTGDVTFDSSIPVADVDGEVDAVLVSYSRGLDIAGKSALLTLAVPYANVALEGLYLGQPASGERQGMGDPFVRLAVNFYGAPALAPEEYAAYRQKTIVGASIAVGVPVGRYVEDRVINVGSNRWSVIGQIGASHQMRKWTVETAIGFAWFSDNDDLLETNTIEQDPIGLFRSTVLYHITRRLWVGAGLLYTHGGTTRLNGIRRDDRQQNWRTGAAVSIPLARGHTLQLRTTEGVTARIGSDFRTYSASYTYSF